MRTEEGVFSGSAEFLATGQFDTSQVHFATLATMTRLCSNVNSKGPLVESVPDFGGIQNQWCA